jgi:Holliday junction resolvase RusA-like endonuclease
MALRMKMYVVNLKPIPWQRPHLNEKTFFDNQKKEKVLFGIYLQQQHNDEPLFGKSISMDLTFFMPIPRSVKDRTKNPYHANRPDLDNLCKFVLDSMKDVIITDDKIISILTAMKVYDNNPRTEILIKEVE